MVACTGDADGLVRYWAALTLQGMQAPEVRAALERLTTDGEAIVRDAARQALAPPTTWF
ncbi:HEAT repeat domain-containing protein [Kitasatospora sp. NPDC007106]|uniref:HEAT repeat domain-containing protein n=1 Tax=Kitasatospora sp. NPDC007106 TaxID=3156914 RepID=UPI0033FE3824